MLTDVHSVRPWSGPNPLVEYLGRLLPGSVLGKPLGVVPVLVVAVAVPVNEPDDRSGLRCRLWDSGPETVVDALLIDVGCVTGMAERKDAKAAVGLVSEAALDPLDGVGVWGAHGDAAVEIVSVTGVLLLLDLDEDLAGLVIFPRSALGLLTALRLFECLLPQAVITGSVLGPLRIVVAPVCGPRSDRDPGQHECSRGQRSRPDSGPVSSVEHE